MAGGTFFAHLDSVRQEISVLGVEFVLVAATQTALPLHDCSHNQLPAYLRFIYKGAPLH